MLAPAQLRRLLESEEWTPVFQLLKRKDHFIFTIESTGILAPEALFQQALAILAGKCTQLAGRL